MRRLDRFADMQTNLDSELLVELLLEHGGEGENTTIHPRPKKRETKSSSRGRVDH